MEQKKVWVVPTTADPGTIFRDAVRTDRTAATRANAVLEDLEAGRAVRHAVVRAARRIPDSERMLHEVEIPGRPPVHVFYEETADRRVLWGISKRPDDVDAGELRVAAQQMAAKPAEIGHMLLFQPRGVWGPSKVHHLDARPVFRLTPAAAGEASMLLAGPAKPALPSSTTVVSGEVLDKLRPWAQADAAVRWGRQAMALMSQWPAPLPDDADYNDAALNHAWNLGNRFTNKRWGIHARRFQDQVVGDSLRLTQRTNAHRRRAQSDIPSQVLQTEADESVCLESLMTSAADVVNGVAARLFNGEASVDFVPTLQQARAAVAVITAHVAAEKSLDGELMVFGPLQNEDLDQQVRDLREVVVASGARLGRSPADSLSFRPAVQLGYP